MLSRDDFQSSGVGSRGREVDPRSHRSSRRSSADRIRNPSQNGKTASSGPKGAASASLRAGGNPAEEPPQIVAAFVSARESGNTSFLQEWLDTGVTVVITASAPSVRPELAPARPKGDVLDDFPGLQLDGRRHSATWQGKSFHLTRIELRLLAVLTDDPGRVLSYADLTDLVWRTAYCGDIDRIRSAVKRLRAKLQATGADVAIEAVRGVGFRAASLPA